MEGSLGQNMLLSPEEEDYQIGGGAEAPKNIRSTYRNICTPTYTPFEFVLDADWP